MKKLIHIFCLAFVALTISANAFGQVKFGLKFGADKTTVSFDNHFFDSNSQIGFLVSPMLDVKIPLIGLGFDLAVQYNNKKAKIETDDPLLDSHCGYVTLQHIEVPVNLKWTIGNDKVFSVYAATGPQVSWNISNQSLEEVFEIDQYTMRSSLFSWNLGAGFTAFKKLRLGYTYNIAIGETANINFMDEMGNLISSKLKNNTHQFFIAYFF